MRVSSLQSNYLIFVTGDMIMKLSRDKLKKIIKEELDNIVAEQANTIVDKLLDNTDGPVTPFVVMSRAVKMAQKNPTFDSYELTNALHDALAQVGVRELDGDGLPSGEFPSR
jgi:hypothetical protein